MERFRPGPESVLKTSKYGRYMAVVRTPVAFGPSGSTAEHEAAHVVASDGEIDYASIIPQGDALGVTKPKKMTPAAAAGAAADGHDGFSWDQFLTEYIMGVPFEQAKAGARAKLSGRELEKQAIAGILQRKGIIFQADVDDAYRLADKVRKGVATVVVTLIDHKGKMTRYQTETAKTADQIIDELEEKERREETSGGLQDRQEHDLFTWTERDQALFEEEAEKSALYDNDFYIPFPPKTGKIKRRQLELAA
jgi:hypothetical protein